MTQSISRRTALKLGASTAVLSGLQPLAAAAPAPSSSLEGRIFKSLKGMKGSPMEAFEELKRLGFDGVESGNPAKAAEYAAARAKTGIAIHGKVCGWHWKTRLSSPDAAVRAKGQELLANDLRAVNALGGSSVLLVPGRVTGANETHDDVWNRSIEAVTPVLPLASRLGVRILIETVWNGFCESPEKHRDYVDAFNSPWVGSYFDIGNMQKFAPAEEWIRTLGKRVVKLDVKDWGKKGGFCRLGEGDVDWDKVREALLEIGFSGWATREGRDKNLEDTSALIDQLLIGKTS